MLESSSTQCGTHDWIIDEFYIAWFVRRCVHAGMPCDKRQRWIFARLNWLRLSWWSRKCTIHMPDKAETWEIYKTDLINFHFTSTLLTHFIHCFLLFLMRLRNQAFWETETIYTRMYLFFHLVGDYNHCTHHAYIWHLFWCKNEMWMLRWWSWFTLRTHDTYQNQRRKSV